MAAAVQLEWPDKHHLTLRRSRVGAFFSLCIPLVVLAIWHVMVFGWVLPDPRVFVPAIRDALAREPLWWFPILFALLLVPWLFGGLKALIWGDAITFDATTRTVSRNGAFLAAFDQLRALQIRGFSDPISYDLVLLVQENREIELAGGPDPQDVRYVADAVANVTGIHVMEN